MVYRNDNIKTATAESESVIRNYLCDSSVTAWLLSSQSKLHLHSIATAVALANSFITMQRNTAALALYRDILRAAGQFTWRNNKGELWRDVLKVNARKEFEQAKFERDPAIVARLLFVGRDCLNVTTDKFREAAKTMRCVFVYACVVCVFVYACRVCICVCV